MQTGYAIPPSSDTPRDPDRIRLIFTGRCIALCIACGLLASLPAAADSSIATDPAVLTDADWSRFSPAAETSFLGRGPATDETAGQSHGYNWRGASPTQPDWRGVRRDIAYFLGYQFVAIGALYLAPESISGWSREQKEDYSLSKWRDNVSRPVWDEDVWWLNYVTHPYWGGAYYIQARERGLNRVQSFWYSALISTLYEYGAEALAEPVSAQDLVVTPVAGFLVGEYLFAPLRQRIRAKPGELDWSDKATLFITDPLGVINAETDRLLGVKTTLQWQSIAMRTPAMGMGSADVNSPAASRRATPAWGLQFRVDW
jgi:hypothetical protein